MPPLQPLPRPFKPAFVMGKIFVGNMLQGDFVFQTDAVRMGIFRPKRQLPPGVAPDPVVSLGAFAVEDPWLLVKVSWSYFFAAVLLRLRGQREFGRQILFLTALVTVLQLATTAMVKSSMDLFYFAAPAVLVIAVLAITMPVLTVRYRSRASFYIALVATAIFLCVLLFLPGSSSNWFPFVWPIFLCWAKSAEGRISPDSPVQVFG